MIEDIKKRKLARDVVILIPIDSKALNKYETLFFGENYDQDFVGTGYPCSSITNTKQNFGLELLQKDEISMTFKGSIHASKGVSGGPVIGVTDRKVYGILIGI